jgi:predicted 3-demethylubiquinone-9 3-methyltransferase (glyoxalase superfamily)
MSKITPCLWFDGDAEEAARLYVALLPGSRIDKVQHNVVDSPSGPAGSVLVVEFTLAGQSFMAINGGMTVEYNWSVSMSIACEDQAEVDRLWDAILAGGGKAEQCGWIADRWGLRWQITPKILPRLIADPDKAKAARVMQAMMEMVKIDVAALEAAYRG